MDEMILGRDLAIRASNAVEGIIRSCVLHTKHNKRQKKSTDEGEWPQDVRNVNNTHCISLVVIELEHCLELLQIIYVSNVKIPTNVSCLCVLDLDFFFLVFCTFHLFVRSFYALQSLSHAPPNNSSI